ncbi:hypothetical protein TJA_20190 [Thermus sp. LT1-2-5]|uniref:hypothetical protein n=1 Tax=Thermus sp. LT1-2-5 TaxID=3026935 RepID=UPI0030E83988
MDLKETLKRMAWEYLEREGLPLEVYPNLVRLYAHAAVGWKDARKPKAIRELEDEVAPFLAPTERVKGWFLRDVKNLPDLLVEVPLRLLGKERKDFSEEAWQRARRLLFRGFSGFEAAIWLLWREEARQGGGWWNVVLNAERRLGGETAWALLLSRAYVMLRRRGLEPNPLRPEA